MTKNLAILCLLLLLFIVPFAAGEDSHQKIEGDVLRDLDYGFELKRPNANWVFLDEEEIKQFYPNAVAGAYNPKIKIYLAVIAEEVSNVELSDYGSFMLSNFNVDNRQILLQRELKIGEKKAGRYKISGNNQGVDFTYFITIYQHEGFFYQIASWWISPMIEKEPEELVEIHDKFSFIPDVKPHPRDSSVFTVDEGIGWRLDKDGYTNVIDGFRCRHPGKGWRFMGARELREVNSNASMGIENEREGIYAIVIAERITGISDAEYEDMILGMFEADHEVEKPVESKVELCGEELTRHLYDKVRMENISMDFTFVITSHDDVGIQILAWWFHAKERAAKARLDDLYQYFSWLEKDEKERLSKDFVENTNIERSVGPGECFRNLVYRNFPFGFTLKLPKAFWKHAIGSDARYMNDDANLILEHLDTGMNCILILEELENFNSEEYHLLVTDMYEAPAYANTEIHMIGSHLFRSTRFTSIEEGREFVYNLITSTQGSKHMQLMMFGFALNMNDTQSIEKNIMEGIEFTGEEINASEILEDGSFVDYQLGFRFSPQDDEMVVKDVTPEHIRSLGTMFQAVTGDSDVVCTGGSIHADINMDEFVHKILSSSEHFRDMNLKFQSKEDFEWMGLPGKMSKYTSAGLFYKKNVSLLTASQAGTFYFLFVTSKGDESTIDTAMKGYQLLQ
jgi:hypothetical protein